MYRMKKNILLVMPRIVNRIGEGYIFPLGIPYVSAAMKAAGMNVFCLNLNHVEGNVFDTISMFIDRHNIDALFIGGTSGQYYPVKVVIDSARIFKPNILILVGGGIITADPESAMEALEVADIGVIGEGEITDVEVAMAFENERPFDDIPGIIIRDKEKGWIRTTARKEIDDLDLIPWPDYDGFEFEKTLSSNAAVAGVNFMKSIAMLASRSCPFNCSFCFHTVGRRYRQRSLDGFFSELEYNINKYGIEYLLIEDELFTYNNERVVEFCKRIKKFNIKWWAQLRVDSIDTKLIKTMKDAGCINFSLGLESADNSVLKAMGKNITVEQIEETLSAVKRESIASEGSFILGDESETYETANNTLNWWKNHIEYRITLGTITVFPGSKLYINACKKGIIKDKVQYLKDGCPQINITQMSDKEFAEITEKVMRLPVEGTDTLDKTYDVVLDKRNSRVDFSTLCTQCGKGHGYKSIKLFMHAPLSCPNCGKKYSFLVPSNFLRAIEENTRRMVNNYGKVVFWGVNYQTYNLIDKIQAFQLEGALFVDSSNVKQNLIINNKNIFPPSIIAEQGIEIVVVNIPTHFAEIELQIKYQYPNVKRVIDIGALVDESFE